MLNFKIINNISEVDSDDLWIGVENFKSQYKLDVKRRDFVDSLPQKLILAIFSYLNSKELTRCFRVNQKWKELAGDETLWKALFPKIAFGKEQWDKYFGDVGQVPSLPKGIDIILKDRCPFWPEKKVEETHMLVLIPQTVNGKPLNLITLGELVKAPKEGDATQYKCIWDKIIDEDGKQNVPQSYFVLMTKDVIPGSRNKSFANQQILLDNFIKRTEIKYEVPRVLDAAICIFMHFISSKKRLFAEPCAYTRCQERVYDYHVIVGSFSSSGLFVGNDYVVNDFLGVAALRRFF